MIFSNNNQIFLHKRKVALEPKAERRKQTALNTSIELTNICSAIDLFNRKVHEERRQFQFLAVFVAQGNAPIAGAKVGDGECRLANHVLLAKHICGEGESVGKLIDRIAIWT